MRKNYTMATSKEEPLFFLIKSMSKSEKRHFKLYVNRTSNKENIKFIMLFDALEGMKSFVESAIFKKVPELKKTQLSNMKAHLYKQILTSLRLNHINSNVDIQLRENLDYARILYNKGLYKQALKMLDKNKQLSITAKNNMITLEILEFEKLIESQYITRSIGGRADELTNETKYYNKVISQTNEFSNLALQLYGLYLKVGYARNEKDFLYAQSFLKSNLPKYNYKYLTFYERLYLFQSLVWYNFIIQDFVMCYRNAQKWVNLFHQNPEMVQKEPMLYAKGLHNLLAALFNLQHHDKFCEVLEEMVSFSKDERYVNNENLQVVLFLYVYSNKINQHYMEGEFTSGLKLIPSLLQNIEHYADKLDDHRILVFYYKIACLYFGSGDNINAIKYLQMVIDFKDTSLRGDIHCFARILNLIAHYEEGIDDRLEYHIKSVYHFLGKMDDLQAVQKEIISFLRKLNRITLDNLKQEFTKLRNKLAKHAKEKYERRPFLYLDIISWLESKIYNKPVQLVIKEKRKLGVATLNDRYQL